MAIRETLDKIKKSIQDKIDETKLDFAMRRSASGGTAFSKTDEKQLMQLIESYLSGNMKPDEMMTFINLTKKYFYHTKGLDPTTELPRTIIEPLTKNDPSTGETQVDASTIAAYNRARNVFIINEPTFKKCLDSIKDSNKSYLMDIINFTGHELTHFDQHLASEGFESLPPEKQRDFDKKTYEVIKDIEGSYETQLDAQSLLDMDSFMGKYTKSMQDFGFSIEHFKLFQKVRYFKYTYERDARNGAIDFSKGFMALIGNSEFASDKVKAWAEKNQDAIGKFEQQEIMIEDEIISKKEHKLLDDYYASVGKQALAKIVNDNEHKSFNLSQSLLYKRCVAEIIEHFSYKEKEEYLKVAIARNLPQFANIIIKSIKKDPEYLENNVRLKDMLTTSLANGEFDMGAEKPPMKINHGKIYGETIDYSLLLSEDRLSFCVMSCLDKNNYGGANKISSLLKNTSFSSENILKQAQTIEKNNLYGKEYAIKALLVNVSFEDSVKLLEIASRENLPTLKKELLTQLNQMPEYHLNRAKVLKNLTMSEEETKYKTIDEIILTGCAEYYEKYYFDSFLSSDNNPQKSAAIQKVREYFKTIYKQELKKGGKALESQMQQDTSIQDFLTGYEFDFDVAKKIADNQPACLSLLKALSDGSIVINGQKVTLNDDNKMKLARLLVSTLNQKEWNRQFAELEAKEQQVEAVRE